MINQVVTNQTDQLVYTNRTYSTRLIIGLHSALIITSVKVVTNQTDQPIYTNRNYNTRLIIALYSAPMITCVQVVERRSIRHSLQYLSHPHDEITELINKQIQFGYRKSISRSLFQEHAVDDRILFTYWCYSRWKRTLTRASVKIEPLVYSFQITLSPCFSVFYFHLQNT